jgi:hypothetical protein
VAIPAAMDENIAFAEGVDGNDLATVLASQEEVLFKLLSAGAGPARAGAGPRSPSADVRRGPCR